jgi:outer membrane protein
MAGARRLFPALCLVCAATGARAESLLELYRITLDSNPILKGKEFALDQAKAQQDQALSKLLPQLMATGSYQKVDFRQSIQRGPQNLPDNRDFSEQYWGTQGSIQARQALFDLPSYLRLQGAESFTLQSEKEVDAVRMAVAYDLADR